MSEQTRDTNETIELLDRKITQLKREYDQYFLGTRPREPVLLLGEVRKTVAFLSNSPIQNTAMRFKFASICSRYQALKRQWDDIQRKIEAGTYERHLFKAKIHGVVAAGANGGSSPSAPAPARSAGSAGSAGDDLYREYLDARTSCGQSTASVSREKLEEQLERQRSELRKKFGADAKFTFRVAVEDGKVRLKAKRVKE
jgi:hypothetical protein